MNNKITELEPSTSRKRPRHEESEPQSENDVEDPLSLSLGRNRILKLMPFLFRLGFHSGQFLRSNFHTHIVLLWKLLLFWGGKWRRKEENFTFSDTLMALRMMRAQFPHIEKVSVPPFILQSQLYSSISDRTQVDREIESLKRERVLRVFKLNTGQDDHAIMFVDDYINQIKRVVRKMEEKKQTDIVIFEWFKTHVVQSKLDTSIGHEELWSFLSLGGKEKEEHISQLISAGLLIRRLIDENMYWFSIPYIGSVLKGLSQGRKEVLSLLSRKKYKEMMMSSLEKKRLRFSPLDMRFHLRDLIGSGHVKTLQTPSGLIVRVAKD